MVVNAREVCFIICYTDEKYLNKCVACINDLEVPNDIDIDILAATEVDNVADAYNEMMKSSNAKYKVYLYENLYILNKKFIFDMIESFEKDSNVGMLGIMGESVQTGNNSYGIWDTGKIIIGSNTRNEFIYAPKEEGYVVHLNGLLMATNRDIDWKAISDDCFGFCDIDHSERILAEGYQLKVISQRGNDYMYEAGETEYSRYDVYTEDYGSRYLKPHILKEKPLVSTIICVYNGERFLADNIESVVNQTYVNHEIIIVDDASTDNSRNIINHYKQIDSRIKVVYLEQNGNVCNAGNVGCSMASGKYIAIIGHDDIWNPEKLSRQIEFMEAFSDVAVCFTTTDIIDSYGEVVSDSKGEELFNVFNQKNRSSQEWFETLFFVGNFLCAPSAVIRKNCIKKDLYNWAYVQLQDYDLWINTVCEKEIYVLQERLVNYRHDFENPTNLSSMDRKKSNRLWHESQYLKYRLIRDISDDNFVRLFEKRIKNQKAIMEKDHNLIRCEKAMLLKDMGNFMAAFELMELINEEETRLLLENVFNFKLSDFYQYNTTGMHLDMDLVEEIKGLFKQ